MDSSKYPSSSTYSSRFGSWNKALRVAGLKVNVRTRYTKTELVEGLKQLRKELGRVPKTSDLKNKKWLASYSTFRKLFGTWEKALKASGISKKEFSSLKDFSRK